MKKILVAFIALGALAWNLIGCGQNSPAVRTLPTPAAANLARGAEINPATVIAAYYTALNARDMETALNLMPDNVVFHTLRPNARGEMERVEYNGIEVVQNLVVGDRTVLSRHIDQLAVNGDTVEYTLTEWLNPRIVGMNTSQPFILHCTAQIRDGKILSITRHTSPF